MKTGLLWGWATAEGVPLAREGLDLVVVAAGGCGCLRPTTLLGIHYLAIRS